MININPDSTKQILPFHTVVDSVTVKRQINRAIPRFLPKQSAIYVFFILGRQLILNKSQHSNCKCILISVQQFVNIMNKKTKKS